jgi:hypothetical protein
MGIDLRIGRVERDGALAIVTIFDEVFGDVGESDFGVEVFTVTLKPFDPPVRGQTVRVTLVTQYQWRLMDLRIVGVYDLLKVPGAKGSGHALR